MELLRGVPPLLQVLGLGLVAAGLGLVYFPAGVIAAGAGLFLVGLTMDQS